MTLEDALILSSKDSREPLSKTSYGVVDIPGHSRGIGAHTGPKFGSRRQVQVISVGGGGGGFNSKVNTVFMHKRHKARST
jgi:hypothetical protein